MKKHYLYLVPFLVVMPGCEWAKAFFDTPTVDALGDVVSNAPGLTVGDPISIVNTLITLGGLVVTKLGLKPVAKILKDKVLNPPKE